MDASKHSTPFHHTTPEHDFISYHTMSYLTTLHHVS